MDGHGYIYIYVPAAWYVLLVLQALCRSHSKTNGSIDMTVMCMVAIVIFVLFIHSFIECAPLSLTFALTWFDSSPPLCFLLEIFDSIFSMNLYIYEIQFHPVNIILSFAELNFMPKRKVYWCFVVVHRKCSILFIVHFSLRAHAQNVLLLLSHPMCFTSINNINDWTLTLIRNFEMWCDTSICVYAPLSFCGMWIENLHIKLSSLWQEIEVFTL